MRLWLVGMRAARRMLSQLSLTLRRLFVLVMRCGRLWEQIGLRPAATVCSAAGNYKEIYRRACLTIDLFFLLKKNLKTHQPHSEMSCGRWRQVAGGVGAASIFTNCPLDVSLLIELNRDDSLLRTRGGQWFDQQHDATHASLVDTSAPSTLTPLSHHFYLIYNP